MPCALIHSAVREETLLAQEIGVAYVALLPSGKGFGRAVEGEIDGAVGAGEKRADGFFKRVVKGAGLAVAGAVTAVTGITLGKGIARALNIEDAQAKLKGLGHDAQSVEQIMNDALASVRGTAFGLDTAATVAATAVAAGIKPGQELEKYLRLTADAATIAGASMEEIGSILNKTTTSGRVFTEELNQLADRGLPVFQWLQDEYGVTADELRDMVSRGEVDAATFRKVLEENIGGAALASGDTTRGALANIGAAVGRLGAVFAGPALGNAKAFFDEVIIFIDGVTERIKPAAEGWSAALSSAFPVDGLGERALAGLDRFIDAVTAGPIPRLFEAFEPLLPLVATLAGQLGGVLGDAVGDLGRALEPVIPILATALSDAITQLSPSLVDLLEALIPVIPPLAELAAEILPPLVEVLELLAPLAVDGFDRLAGALDGIVKIVDFLSGDTSFGEFLQQARDFLGSDVAGVAEAAGGAVGALIRFFQDAASTFMGFVSVVSTALGNVQSWFSSAFTVIQTIVAGAILVVQGLITGNMEQVQRVVSGVLDSVKGFFSRTWETIVAGVSAAWGMIVSAVTGGAGQAVQGAVGQLQTLPSAIGRIFSGVGTWLKDAGRALIQGFIDGIKSMVGAVGDAVDGVLAWAQGFFPRSPAKRGTFSGEGWTKVADGGRSLLDQFASGIRAQTPSIDAAFAYSLSMPSASLAGVAPGSPFADGQAVNVNVIDADGVYQGVIRGQITEHDDSAARFARGRLTPR